MYRQERSKTSHFFCTVFHHHPCFFLSFSFAPCFIWYLAHSHKHTSTEQKDVSLFLWSVPVTLGFWERTASLFLSDFSWVSLIITSNLLNKWQALSWHTHTHTHTHTHMPAAVWVCDWTRTLAPNTEGGMRVWLQVWDRLYLWGTVSHISLCTNICSLHRSLSLS